MKQPQNQYEAAKQQEGAMMLPGQARILNEDEMRLREFFIHQSHYAQNVAPGSPLYDKVMGTNTHADWSDAYAEARRSHAAG